MITDFEVQLAGLKKIQKLLLKHKELLDRYNISFDTDIVYALKRAELSAEFGIDLSNQYGYDWFTLRQDVHLGFMDGVQRTISWSDDGNQPNNEWLLKVSFPSGAYSLDKGYPVSLFQEMFLELKSFEPKYCDTANKSLYFDSTKAKAVFDAYDDIFAKYKGRVDEWKREDRLKKLKAELKALEGE